jgi:thiol-disulfide isomerase/thioredoxin
MSTRSIIGLALIVPTAVVVFFVLSASGTGERRASACTGVAPQCLPDMDFVDLNHEVHPAADVKGKVVVVNFWATWCGPCVAEFPDLVKLYKNNKAKGLELIAISADESADGAKVKTFLGKNGLSKGYLNKNAVDIEGYLKYLEPNLAPDAPGGIPRTYVIDRNGKVVKSLIGGQSYTAFQSAVTPLLAKK